MSSRPKSVRMNQFQSIISILGLVLLGIFVSNLPQSHSSPSGYLLWGTRYLYRAEKFPVASEDEIKEKYAPAFQERNGFRGEYLVSNLTKSGVTANNSKLIDVEDATRSYKSPYSFW